MTDLRYALRQLRRTPSFTTVAILTLAICIGACTAIFSVVNSVLLRPLPIPEPGHLVVVRETFLPKLPEFSVASGKYFVWKAEARSFENLGAFEPTRLNLTGRGDPVRVSAMRMSASALPTLRQSLLLGRNFLPEEEVPGQDQVAILSSGLWRRQLGGRRDVLGEAIHLSGRSHRIVGVLPEDFLLPENADVFIPYAPDARARQNFGGHGLGVIGRLRANATIEDARQELGLIATRLARERPLSRGWGVKLDSFTDVVVGEIRPVLWSLVAAVGLLLLIASANIAGLMLIRTTARAREMAVRTALGASRSRIVRQLLIESLLLAILGGGTGVILAEIGVQALLVLAPDTLPRAAEIAVDARALAFTLLLALSTGLGFGIAPALSAFKAGLGDVLKDGGRGSSEGARSRRFQSVLVVAEIAIALVLLAGAGLLTRSFSRLGAEEPGFRADGAMTASLHLPVSKYQSPEALISFAEEALRRLEAIPGVKVAAAGTSLPFSDSHEARGFAIAGRQDMQDENMPVSRHYNVTPGYFRAMGIRLLRGRHFTAADRNDAAPVAIINEHLARKFFPGEDPLGKRISISNDGPRWREIVGVVQDVKAIRLDGQIDPQTYEPYAVMPNRNLSFVLRASKLHPGLPAAIRSAISSVDSDQPVSDLRPLSEGVSRSIARQRFAMTLFGVFSGVALLLAALGTYGVMAYSVSRRTGEIGIRMALGAHTQDVLGLLMAQGARLTALGLALGLGGALLLSRFLETMLHNVGSRDPATFAAITALLALVATAACWLPARRAARIDPLIALRAE